PSSLETSNIRRSLLRGGGLSNLLLLRSCLLLVAIVAYLAAGGRYKWFYVVFKTAPRDLKFKA
ncbi:hypothetical protein L9F63_018185, partial [Diploptera punctata]